MKYVRMFMLVALATTAVLVFAATASATAVTSNGSSYTSTIKAESEGTTTLDGVADISCNKSTFEGTVQSHGSSVTAEGQASSLTFSECNQHTHITIIGGFIFHATSNGNSTWTWYGFVWVVTITSLGLTCEYSFSNTDVGTVTGSSTTGGHATLDIDSAVIPRTGGSFFCGSSAEWTGSYTFTTPSNLNFD